MNDPVRFAAHNHRVRTAALRAFSQRRFQRRVVDLSLFLFAVSIGLWLCSPQRRPPLQSLLVTPEVSRQHADASEQGFRMVSDAELLSMFPPGSCYIAEVNGDKRLFFHDEAVKSRYLN